MVCQERNAESSQQTDSQQQPLPLINGGNLNVVSKL